MSQFEPAEKGVTIRVPSTANLMISSRDRMDLSGGVPIFTYTQQPNPWSFQITRRQALLNGYFTRIGMTEMVLDWKEPNVSPNSTFTIDISGGGSATSTFPGGFYTIAQALNKIAADLSGSGISIQGNTPASINLKGTTAFSIQSTYLSEKLGFITDEAPELNHYLYSPDLRAYRYIDFISEQLTYNQDLKDSTTSPFIEKNVICRWYFAWDTDPALDQYGFPIIQGYTPFCQRRLYNPPKQIKWDPTMPIGNLAFTVTDEYGSILFYGNNYGNSEWDMTLQISEV